ncbi:hypothetical protein H4R34_000525 [Dimargaris verticillata]|uniref:NAD(P)-binding domain-containing protein n=1 Tax=Dimargaris verticillata TaxID=2761393 RepID=A0A9W8B7W6_9FUNG|nr:hypothetical protein H4R34_000525 [Dimargaris verticillata]
MTAQSCQLLVTSADGYTGFKAVQYLCQLQVSGTPATQVWGDAFAECLHSLTIVAAVTDPLGPRGLALSALGATVVQLDPCNPVGPQVTWPAILAAAAYVLLIPPTHDDRVPLTLALIAACRTAQVPNVLLWSSLCNQQTPAQFASQFRCMEAALRDPDPPCHAIIAPTGGKSIGVGRSHSGDGLPRLHHWAILRVGWCMEYLYLHQAQVQHEAKLVLPTRSGYFAPVRLRDVAIAVVQIIVRMQRHALLCSHPSIMDATAAASEKATAMDPSLPLPLKRRYYRQTFNFTGPELVTGHRIATTLSSVVGKPIEYRSMASDAVAKYLLHQCQMVSASTWPVVASLTLGLGDGGKWLPGTAVCGPRELAGAAASDDEPGPLTSDGGSSSSAHATEHSACSSLVGTPTDHGLATNTQPLTWLSSTTLPLTPPFVATGPIGLNPSVLVDAEPPIFKQPNPLVVSSGDNYPQSHPLRLLSPLDTKVIMEMYDLIRHNRFDLITGDLAAVLEAEPETLQVFLSKKRSDFSCSATIGAV